MDVRTALTGRDHGGGLDTAISNYGGRREDWIDLSTGINPNPYPFEAPSRSAWTQLPDRAAITKAETAARKFWNIPDRADLLLTPGLSIVIAQLPSLFVGQDFFIQEPTYNEYRAAFKAANRTLDPNASLGIFVSPNNPSGDWASEPEMAKFKTKIIDESFADIAPGSSFSHLAEQKDILIMKGLGKFWGLAGLRFGAVFGDPTLIQSLRERLGPWPVSGPALDIAAQALNDAGWAEQTRALLHLGAAKMDAIMEPLISDKRGTPLFRLYQVNNASELFEFFAGSKILTRVFPYSNNLIRLGLPKDETEFSVLADTVSKAD